MEGENNIIDGRGSDRTEVSEGEPTPESTRSGTNCDGSDGTGASMESVAEPKAEEKQKEDPELLLKQSYAFRDHAIQTFAQLARVKYNKGQEEHGGFLPARCTWEDMESEILDLWFYIYAMKSKVYNIVPDKAGVIFGVNTENK